MTTANVLRYESKVIKYLTVFHVLAPQCSHLPYSILLTLKNVKNAIASMKIFNICRSM